MEKFDLLELLLNRLKKTSTATIGELSLNGKFFCYTLEDTDRDYNGDGDLKDAGEEKVYGETCIPKGNYDVVIDLSQRFKREMIHILNVQGFEGIRMHGGNRTKDTLGCPLVAYNKFEDQEMIQGSAEKDLIVEVRKYKKTTIKII